MRKKQNIWIEALCIEVSQILVCYTVIYILSDITKITFLLILLCSGVCQFGEINIFEWSQVQYEKYWYAMITVDYIFSVRCGA